MIAIRNCKVQQSSSSAAIEVVTSPRKSKVEISSWTFELPNVIVALDPDRSLLIGLEELDDLSLMQAVTLTAKVVQIQNLMKITGTWPDLTKQDGMIADTTGSA